MESYSCGCGFDFESTNELITFRNQLNKVIEKMEADNGIGSCSDCGKKIPVMQDCECCQ